MKPVFIGHPNLRRATRQGAAPLALIALVGVVLSLAACASRTTTADTLWRDQQIARQQIDQKPQAPNDRGLYLSLIVQMQAKGLYFASLAHIDAFEKRYGQAGDIALLRGDALRETGQPAAAIAVYRQWTNGDTAAAAQHGLGRALADEHDNAGAMVALQTAVALDPTNVSYLNDLAYARLLNGDVAGARIPVAQAAELAAENPKVIANLALYLMLSGQAAQADAVMVRAKMSPEAQRTTRSMAASMRVGHGGASTHDGGERATGDAGPAVYGRDDGAVRPTMPDDPTTRQVRNDAVAWQGGSVLQRFAQTR
ncbi:tetratricopeptide repeat protein [Robbsia andropogonis]|uniref:hypothetical protein n=1 Tax=Robbsia andropogonis TaxID=28092 RepID=UPI000465AC9B|nr:hypothetical protein [Robbsia andropogonis]MCP1117559.1 pilus assembly protein [Robbsia andropogonis]MCP1127025.1 pilus assembly protein [Robbsia andropogonis]